MNLITIILLTILLVALNAFFVTAEFSLLRIRKTRLQKLFNSNTWGTEALKQIMKNLNFYIISSQIGITLTTLCVGLVTLTYSQTILVDLVGSSLVLRALGVVVAILLVSFIHSVIGEIIPKLIAIQHVESLALRVAPALYYVSYGLLPLTTFYRFASTSILSLLSIDASDEVYSRVYSEDELKLIVAQSHEEGEIDESEQFLINRVLDFSDTRVNEVFRPRYEIVAFEKETPVDEIIEQAVATGYSRFPIYKEKLDHVEGFVHVKDLLLAESDDGEFSLESILRPVFIIHEAMRLDLLLKRMQQDRTQVAIVVDEYGSVEGLVTIEDILESIVGPIDDEFDIDSVELVKKVSGNKFIVDGRVTLDVFNQAFYCQLAADDSVTIAGFILEHLESVPEEGSQLEISSKTADFEFEVIKMDGNRVDQAKVLINRKNVISEVEEDDISLSPENEDLADDVPEEPSSQ